MDDVEYILRIVLKARDDMALVLAKARRELRSFAKGADEMNKSVSDLNKAMEKFNNNMDGVTKKLEGWRAILRDAADGSNKSAKSLDSMTKAAEKNARATKKVAETQKQLQDRARALRDEMRAITKEHEAGTISTKTAIAEYNRFGKEFDKIVLKMSEAARKRTPAQLWADEASTAAEAIKTANDKLAANNRKFVAEQKKANEEALSAAVDKRAQAEKDISKIVESEVADRVRLTMAGLVADLEAQKAADKEKVSQHKLTQKQLEQNIVDYNKRIDNLAKGFGKDYESALSQAQKNTSAINEAEVADRIRNTVAGLTAGLEAERKADEERIAQNKATQKQLEQNIVDYNKRVDNLVKEWGDEYNKVVRETEAANTDIVRAEAEERTRIKVAAANAEIDRLLQQQAETERIAADIERRRLANVKLGNAEVIREIEQQITAEEREAKQRYDNNKRWDDLQAKARARMRLAERLGQQSKRVDDTTDPSEVRRLSAEYSKLANSYRAGSGRAREFGAASERLRITLRGMETDTRNSESALSKLRTGLKGGGDSVAGFDNQVRGMGLLLAVTAAQQLISAVVALGGELVSLAGSAAMAGGALGGILAAGAAQALPVIGLLAGAFQRVKSVMDAVQQSQKLQQAQFTDAEKGGQKAADKTNALANANDAVAEANDRLAESRKNLTAAQKEGVDQLQDLILAERQAGLAARGAALDVKAAQEALRLAISSGASQLEIDQKRLAVDEARNSQKTAGVTLKRATRDRQAAGGDVNNLDSVKQAAKSVDDAEKAVKRANRGLDQAEEKTGRAASTTMTAAANLNFLLSQLSPAERRLYDAAKSLYDSYKKIFQGEGTGGSGIYGVIIDAFTRAVTKVESIMEMPKVIAGIQDLANVIGKNIDKIVDAVDPQVIDQLLTIIGDAGDNMGPLVDMAIKLAEAFLNIAETANPAFQELIKYLGPIVDKFLAMTADKGKMEDFFLSGEDHLESWLDLVGAIIGLFAALVGASADSGKTSIDDLTEKIKGYTDWINDHKKDVVAFFEDARKAAYAIGGVVEHLAVALFNAFDSERVKNFAGILNDVVIPAVFTVVEVFGKLVDKVAEFLDSPTGVRIAKAIIIFALFSKIAFGLLGVFDKLYVAGERVVKFAELFGGPLGRLAGYLIRILGLTELLKTALGVLRVAAMAALGPWGLAIAAIIIAVVFLLKHFGKLDDVWEGLKKAFATFLDDLKPAIEALQEAFAGLGIHISSFKGLLKFLEGAGKFLAEFIAVYLVEGISGLFKILAGVATFLIRVFAGVIKYLHGVADIFVGVFTLDGDQIKKGIKELVDGVIDIFWGIVDGLKLVLSGIGKLFLAPFKAAWRAVKGFFGVESPSKKAKELGHALVEGIKDGLVGLARALTAPWRRAWSAVNNFFDGKPKKLADDIVDAFVDRLRALYRRVRNAASFLWHKFTEAWDAAKNFGGTIVDAIVEGVKGLPAALLKAVTGIGSQLLEVGKSIGGKIAEGVKGAFTTAKGFLGKLIPGGDDDNKDQPKGPVAGPPKPAPTVSFDIGVGAIPFGAKDLKSAKEIYSQFWKDLRRAARESTDYIQRQFREMRISTSQSSDRMYRDVRSSIADLQNSFDVRGKAIVDNWANNWLSMMKITNEGLFYIGHETNKALTTLGDTALHFHLTAPTKSKGHQRGGVIDGSGDGDKVHVLAEPGEGFINKRAVRALGGPGVINAINSMIPRFQAGGIVPIPGQPGETIHKSILGDVMKLIRTYKLKIYDGYAPTGHAAGGEHPKGLAIDAGPGLGGSWDLVDKLARWAEPSQNNPRSPFRWVGYTGDAGHGRNDHIHLSWVAGKTITGLADFATQVMKRMVTGPGGGFKAMLNASIEGVRKVANKFLDEKASAYTSEGAEDIKVGNVGPGAANIFKFFRRQGFSDEQAAGWIGNWTQESGLDPTVQNSIGASGVGQWLSGRFSGLQDFAKSKGKPWQDLGTQLAWTMHELHGSESAAYTAIKAAKTVQDATNAIAFKYERMAPQEIGNRIGPAQTAFHKFSGKFDKGGIIDGPDGAPTPILAHAGEWVLNKGQQLRAAMLSGLSISGLRSMLGFHGKGGEWGYAGGTQVTKRISSIVSGREDDLSDVLLQSVRESMSDLRGLAKAIASVKNITRSVRPVIDLIELATKEDGFLDRLRGSIERQFARAALSLRRQQYKVDERTGRVTKELSDVQVARRARNDARGQREELKDERRTIQGELGTVSDKLALTGKRRVVGTARDKLQAQQVDLNKRLADSQERIVQNTEDIFNAQEELARAQEAAAEKRKDDFQKTVDKVKERFTKRGAQNDRAKRIASALGSPKLVEAANKATEDTLRDNLTALSRKLAQAKKQGFTEIAEGLAEDIAELQTQIVELAQQKLRDAADAIGTAASRRSTVLDLFGRMADAMGVVGQGIQAAIPGVPGAVGTGLGARSRAEVAQGRIDSARQEQADYVGLLGKAQAAGNIGLSQELIDKINELTVSIAENTKAAFDARIQDVSTRHDYTQSMNDLDLQLLDLDSTITGTDNTLKKQELLTKKQNDLTDKGNELSGLLAEATPGTQTYLDLQKAIKENEVATKQNTVALNELSGAGSAPSSFTSTAWQWFRSAILTGTGNVMPQYTAPTMANVSSIGPGGTSSSTVNGGDTNIQIEINEAGQPIDATQVANVIVFAQSTAQ